MLLFGNYFSDHYHIILPYLFSFCVYFFDFMFLLSLWNPYCSNFFVHIFVSFLCFHFCVSIFAVIFCHHACLLSACFHAWLLESGYKIIPTGAIPWNELQIRTIGKLDAIFETELELKSADTVAPLRRKSRLSPFNDICSPTKPRWVKKWYQSLALSSLFSRWYFVFLFKGTLFFKSIKLVLKFNDNTNQLCRINVETAANSLYWWSNF
jgi:hypothetical protein